MSKIYCRVNPDSSVQITKVAANGFPDIMSDEEWLDYVLTKTAYELAKRENGGAASEHFDYYNPAHRHANYFHEMDSAELPQERSERGKWRHVGGKVVVQKDV